MSVFREIRRSIRPIGGSWTRSLRPKMNERRRSLRKAKPESAGSKYFEPADSGFAFRKDLRRSFIFGRNDLVQDPPIGRIDLLLSRNTLMYFKPETQGKVLSNFYFALNDSGYLLLGKSEVLLTRSSLFAPTDLKRRVFEKVPQQQIRDRLLSIARSDGAGQMPLLPDERIRDAAIDAGSVPQLVVAVDGTIVLANRQARRLFG